MINDIKEFMDSKLDIVSFCGLDGDRLTVKKTHKQPNGTSWSKHPVVINIKGKSLDTVKKCLGRLDYFSKVDAAKHNAHVEYQSISLDRKGVGCGAWVHKFDKADDRKEWEVIESDDKK